MFPVFTGLIPGNREAISEQEENKYWKFLEKED